MMNLPRIISVADWDNVCLLGSEQEENNKNGSKNLDAMTLIKEGKYMDCTSCCALENAAQVVETLALN